MYTNIDTGPGNQSCTNTGNMQNLSEKGKYTYAFYSKVIFNAAAIFNPLPSIVSVAFQTNITQNVLELSPDNCLQWKSMFYAK